MASFSLGVRLLWGSVNKHSRLALRETDVFSGVSPNEHARDCVVVARGFTNLAADPLGCVQSVASGRETGAAESRSLSGIAARLAEHRGHPLLYRGVRRLSKIYSPLLPPSVSFSFTSLPISSGLHSLNSVRAVFGMSWAVLGDSSSSLGGSPCCTRPSHGQSVPQEWRQDFQEQQGEALELHRQRKEHQQKEHILTQKGQQQRHHQGWQQQDGHFQPDKRHLPLVMMAVSPLLFTKWESTSDPKTELIFLAGNTLGRCTEQFFENEYGQSIFACVLGLLYLSLLGYEGKVNGAVWRMKHVFSTDMKIACHPRYAYALPQNRLLSTLSQRHHS